MYEASRLTQPQVAFIDWTIREEVSRYGIEPRSIDLVEEGGFPVWVLGRRRISLARTTTTQVCFTVSDPTSAPTSAPWKPQPRVAHDLRWPAQSIAWAFAY